MATINVGGSAARLSRMGPLAAAGYCLHYCWLAISQGLVHYITGGADTAYNTWLAVPAQHQHPSREVPKDFPAFLGPRLLSQAGDVIISSGTRNPSGELLFVATDWPSARQVGLCTLAEREKQTGRKFVGWASSMGGHELTSTSTASDTVSPLIEQQKRDTDMIMIRRTSNSRTYTLGQGYLKHEASLASLAAEELITGPAIGLDDGQFVEVLINHGLFEFVPSGSLAVMDKHVAGAMFVASWLKGAASGTGSGVTVANLTAAVKVGSDAVIAKIPTKLV